MKDKNLISKEVFERETSLCQKLYQENKGKCGWGVCNKCGVIPFLIKLHKGQLLENPAQIKKARENIFRKS